MEIALCRGSRYLKENRAGFQISSNAWKVGEFGMSCKSTCTARHFKVSTKNAKLKPCLVKAAFIPLEGELERVISNSSARDGRFYHNGFNAGCLGRMHPGSCLKIVKRPITAVEAGRSKAKKGQISGGRIEQPSRRPRTSRPQKDQDRTERKYGGIDEGEELTRESVVGEHQARAFGGTSNLDGGVLNSTWDNAGSDDKRLRGKFRPEEPSKPKEPQRVGGWGRDKSMQRVITPAEQSRSRRLRNRSSDGTKSQDMELRVPKKKRRPFANFDEDPSIIHPPEYYKYGPFGPHAWKGIPVGELVKGEFDTNQVVFFSSVKDDEEGEDREKHNVCVDYTKAVNRFNSRVGTKYFYAFARRKFGPRPEPWADWTLVAQIAIESRDDLGGELGKLGELFLDMGVKTQDMITQCVAWARPDLTYVRKPRFQLRLEQQEKFIRVLIDILRPDSDSYYSGLCKLLGISVEGSSWDVKCAYEALDEQGKLKCLKHVFTNHPVKILSSARYDNELQEQQDNERESSFVDETFVEKVNDESDQSFGKVEGHQNIHKPRCTSDDTLGQMGRVSEGSLVLAESTSGRDCTSDRYSEGEFIIVKKRDKTRRVLNSAVRPFSYTNLIEEIALIREWNLKH